VQLARLVIHKYRNVAPGTTLIFNPSKNILLGKNATGKSTLLNLLAAVARSDFSALKGEEFSLEYEMHSAQCQAHASVRNERKNPLGSETASFKQELLLLGQDAESYHFTWSLRLAFGVPATAIQIDSTSSGTLVKIESGPGGVKSVAIEDRSFLGNSIVSGYLVAALTALEGEQKLAVDLIKAFYSVVSSGQSRFDESLGFFERMLLQSVTIKVVGFREPVSLGASGVPPEIGASIIQTLAVDWGRTTLEFSSEQLRFLGAAVRQMGFSAGRLKVERIEKRLEEDGEEFQFGRFSFDFTREDGSAINHSLLSFGQKRLLAFYYYLECYPRLVIADELINGLHHHWIENCLDAVGDRQAFLTSQNPLLLDYLHFESAEQARSSFILCRTEKHDGHERMSWSNMAEDDAERFFTAYQAGIQHVSEILRTKGLW
jgi:energy-coupling factor transporter ATP-binding protein EcfA2